MRKRRRLLLVLLAAVVVLGVVAYVTVGRYVFARGKTTPVALSEVEERFFASTSTTAAGNAGTAATATTAASGGSRPPDAESTVAANTTPGSAAPPLLPVPGVYLYATTGGDRVDILGGDHHDYPALTTITVTPSGCGVLQRWDALEERWAAWQRCADGQAVAATAWTNYAEFFEDGVLDVFTCSGEPRPLSAPTGTTWTTTCVDESGEPETHTGTVVGPEPTDVAGEAVDTFHVTVVVTSAERRNLLTIDTWYQDGTDLIVAQTVRDHHVSSSVVGDVAYDEEHSITLTALAPTTGG